MSVCYAVRERGDIGYHEFWENFVAMNKPTAYRIDTERGYSAVVSFRNLCRRLLASKDDEMMIMDEDAVVPQEAYVRLHSRQVPMVGGLTFTGSLPTSPTVWRGFSGQDNGYASWGVGHQTVIDWLKDPRWNQEIALHNNDRSFTLSHESRDLLKRVDVSGLHCVLIQREVIEKVGEPFAEGNPDGTHEDFDFSQRVGRAGFDIFVDFSVVVGHIIAHSIRPYDYWCYLIAQQAQAEEEMKMAEARKKAGNG